ncbi:MULTISPECIES: ferrochelatase [unclassified Thalassotalea]|uniref:ferrochelatase n=1 Tax=unclassified Thalassotalea TaxID=2614972 RepID=UPI0010807BAF|nr:MULTISPECIES: ferrochelatase [unclassified Thalassotalea]NMP15852.1 ferrochelatase [Thalassotalea sp. Y01]QBY04894.1 ferrochelatase [Thalassotalea sp. HSM 43]
MSRYKANNKQLHDADISQGPANTGKAKVGVLLTNLGTPQAPTSDALRVYLRQFLSDPRVVEIPRLVWMIILHGIILRIRPAKSAKLYQSIWTEQGSPLMVISEQQKDKVAEVLAAQYGDYVAVDLAMRYGQPSIDKALQNFQRQGINKIIVMPLYPQYAGPTTGSVFDAVVDEVKSWRWIPSLHFIGSYHDNPGYIDALAASINEHIEQHGKPQKLLLSYHGMPKLFHSNGDPYYCFCHKTTRLLAQKLGFSDDDFVMTFQSRFGKAEWLKPYTDDTIEELAQAGVKHIALISPAFSADCLETLEELDVESRKVFSDAGGETFHYIKALNDRDDHIDTIINLIKPHI